MGKEVRIMAHRVVCDGVTHRLAIATISADGMEVSIEPYSHETAGTIFVNGTIEVSRGPDDKYTYSKIGRQP